MIKYIIKSNNTTYMIDTIAEISLLNTQLSAGNYMNAGKEYAFAVARSFRNDAREYVAGANTLRRKVARGMGSLAVPIAFASELTVGNETVVGGASIAAVSASNEFMQGAGSTGERALRAGVAALGSGAAVGTISYLQQRVYGRVAREGIRHIPKTVGFLSGTLGVHRNDLIEMEEDRHQIETEKIQIAVNKTENHADSFIKRYGSKVLNFLKYPDGWSAKDTAIARTAGTSLNLIHANVQSGSLDDATSSSVEHGSALSIAKIWAGLASGVVAIEGVLGTTYPHLMETIVDKANSPNVIGTALVGLCTAYYWLQDGYQAITRQSN